MLERQTCTSCKIPHKHGELKCSGCGFTFSELGVVESRRGIEGRRVYEYSQTWSFCPLCGEPTGLKIHKSRDYLMTLPVIDEGVSASD
jgi:hypothetical protein